MGNILEAKDPRGVKIYISESTWDEHIIMEPTGHPMMKENLDAIAKTIASPEKIYESKDSDPEHLDYREVYVKEVPSATYYNERVPYTKVVTRVLGGSGEVITAFPAKNPTGGIKGDAIYSANDES